MSNVISLNVTRPGERTIRLLDALGAGKMNSYWMLTDHSQRSHAESVDAIEAKLDEIDREDRKQEGSWRDLLSVARVG